KVLTTDGTGIVSWLDKSTFAVADATTLATGKIQLAGDLAGTATSPTITNAAVINKTLTGYTAGAGTVAATDNILQAIQKVDGNVALKAPLASPTFTGTVSGITKSMVGLANVDNTADIDKPVSGATQTALDLKAPLASPALTGVPTAPTAINGTNTTQVATTAFVTTAVTGAAASDATTLATGKIQLAGDLAGTATSPTITNAAVINKTLT
ncbi:hypothetical protein, partial [Daejeonella sp. H1SJ63]|uniref:hypothetical protein n=1 Tax=Daejeonella sp. H1SJ63 TaxID=3034145 RepID=UPI0032046C53